MCRNCSNTARYTYNLRKCLRKTESARGVRLILISLIAYRQHVLLIFLAIKKIFSFTNTEISERETEVYIILTFLEDPFHDWSFFSLKCKTDIHIQRRGILIRNMYRFMNQLISCKELPFK